MPRMSETKPATARVWRRCPLCNEGGGDPAFEKGVLRVARCARCAMLFANPVDAEFVSGTFYDRLAAPFYLSPDKLESDYAPVRFNREISLFRRHCQQGDVLDIGCSTGAFLHQLTARFPSRYTTLGMDVAGPALDHAAAQGVPVLRGSFLEHDFAGQRFDAVTFWAVLEHLDQPRAFLTKAASLLKPGGHCFILVPNLRSLAFGMLGTRYRYIMPEHLNYFAPDTLRRFVAQEPRLELVTLRSTHFNPVVLWQDRRRNTVRVPDAERAALLKRTTAWKQNPWLAPVRILYAGLERVLGAAHLADNLVVVLCRKSS